MAKTVEDACRLVSVGFDYVCEYGSKDFQETFIALKRRKSLQVEWKFLRLNRYPASDY